MFYISASCEKLQDILRQLCVEPAYTSSTIPIFVFYSRVDLAITSLFRPF